MERGEPRGTQTPPNSGPVGASTQLCALWGRGQSTARSY